MAAADIPDGLRRFIMTSIPSVPYLEALLLMRGDASRDWDAPRMARALYVSDGTARALLEALLAGGAVVPGLAPATFQYEPATDELRAIIDSVATVYASNLVDVTNLIHARTSRNAHRFADAFVWRKDS